MFKIINETDKLREKRHNDWWTPRRIPRQRKPYSVNHKIRYYLCSDLLNFQRWAAHTPNPSLVSSRLYDKLEREEIFFPSRTTFVLNHISSKTRLFLSWRKRQCNKLLRGDVLYTRSSNLTSVLGPRCPRTKFYDDIVCVTVEELMEARLSLRFPLIDR